MCIHNCIVFICIYIYANPNETSCTPPVITRRLNSWNLPSTSSTKSGHADIIVTPAYHNLPACVVHPACMAGQLVRFPKKSMC